MEIMYANDINKNFKKNSITGFYKDKDDLVDYLKDFYGISYDDEWTVKRFLNGLKFKVDEKILEYLKEFHLNEKILDKKIKILSTNEFKFILLIYLLKHQYLYNSNQLFSHKYIYTYYPYILLYFSIIFCLSFS